MGRLSLCGAIYGFEHRITTKKSPTVVANLLVVNKNCFVLELTHVRVFPSWIIKRVSDSVMPLNRGLSQHTTTPNTNNVKKILLKLKV